ncbi:MAG: transposase [Nocardioides sp.]
MGADRADGGGQARWPAKYSRRRIVEAILYLNRTGCSWRQLPHDFPPWKAVYWYFKRWNADGTADRIHDALRAAVRDAAGRDYERLPEHAEAMVKWSMICLMTRRLAPGPGRRPWQPKPTP